MNSVVVDTGAWIALLSRGDRHAAAAAERYRVLSAEGTRLVTTNYIVDETATRLRYGAGLDAALVYRRMLNDRVKARRLRSRLVSVVHTSTPGSAQLCTIRSRSVRFLP